MNTKKKTLAEILDMHHCLYDNKDLHEVYVEQIQALVAEAIPEKKEPPTSIELEEIYQMNGGEVSRAEIYEAEVNSVLNHNIIIDDITTALIERGLLPEQDRT